MKHLFPDHGIGVGLRAPHMDRFVRGKPGSVGWVEVISENFMDWADRPARAARQTLSGVRLNCPMALHGVSMSLGSSDPLDVNYLKRLRDLISELDPLWVSDHLSWAGVGGMRFHDLLPMPYTAEALVWVSDRIDEVQNFLGRRILVENVSSYVRFQDSEMSEWEFLAAVSTRADCGILLDVNNVYVNSINHGFDPSDYLRAIPAHRVGQIHLAGHTRKDTYCVDTHDEPVCDAVWELYRLALRRIGPRSAMIERDANIPAWEELESELRIAARIREEEHGVARSATAAV